MLHLWQDYVLKIQSNIFIVMPEMEDPHTLIEHPEDFRGVLDIALHHSCMQESCIQTLQHEPTGPDHQICGLSEPKSQHLYTLYLLSRCSPVIILQHIHSACRTLRPVTTRDGNMNVWSYLYRVTGQLRILHFLTWCLIAELCHTTWLGGTYRRRGAMWRMHDAVLTGCSTSRSIAWTHGLRCHFEPRERARRDTPEPMHGLAFTNFQDCNTRHVECSTCCVPSSGTHDPTNTTTTATATTMKHAEVLKGNYDTHTKPGEVSRYLSEFTGT